MPIKTFVNNWCAEGPAHHCAIGTGHIAGKLQKLGSLLNIDVIRVC
jgi:L-arabinose isomerase